MPTGEKTTTTFSFQSQFLLKC